MIWHPFHKTDLLEKLYGIKNFSSLAIFANNFIKKCFAKNFKEYIKHLTPLIYNAISSNRACQKRMKNDWRVFCRIALLYESEIPFADVYMCVFKLPYARVYQSCHMQECIKSGPSFYQFILEILEGSVGANEYRMIFSLLQHCVKSFKIRSFFWPIFSCIRTEYRDLLRKSPYSVRIHENADQKKLHIWTIFTQWDDNSFSESLDIANIFPLRSAFSAYKDITQMTAPSPSPRKG